MTVSTTLGGTITATAGVLHLASTSDLTSFPATLHIDAAGDAELVIARAIARNGEITVDRGAYGSTRQAHSAGVTVTTYEPGGGGGGGSGVTVDNTVDAPVAVTGIEAPGATFDGLVARIPPNNLLLGEASPLDPTTGFNTAITVNDESGSGATVQLLGVGDSPFAGSFVQLQSARGTLAAPEILETGDTVGQIGFIGALAADSSDYAALILVQVEGSPAGFAVPGKMTIAVRKLGGGFGGQIVLLPVAGGVVLPSLPTADPAVADQLWNDAGTLKVSAG